MAHLLEPAFFTDRMISGAWNKLPQSVRPIDHDGLAAFKRSFINTVDLSLLSAIIASFCRQRQVPLLCILSRWMVSDSHTPTRYYAPPLL